jgi:hypothetical protein
MQMGQYGKRQGVQAFNFATDTKGETAEVAFGSIMAGRR